MQIYHVHRRLSVACRCSGQGRVVEPPPAERSQRGDKVHCALYYCKQYLLRLLFFRYLPEAKLFISRCCNHIGNWVPSHFEDHFRPPLGLSCCCCCRRSVRMIPQISPSDLFSQFAFAIRSSSIARVAVKLNRCVDFEVIIVAPRRAYPPQGQMDSRTGRCDEHSDSSVLNISIHFDAFSSLFLVDKHLCCLRVDRYTYRRQTPIVERAPFQKGGFLRLLK